MHYLYTVKLFKLFVIKNPMTLMVPTLPVLMKYELIQT